jgi:hypothetical protein
MSPEMRAFLESRKPIWAAEDRFLAAMEARWTKIFAEPAQERAAELDAYVACPEAFEHRLVPYTF